MENEKIDRYLLDAKNKVIEKFGNKKYYTYFEALEILKEDLFYFEIDLDDCYRFLSNPKMYDFTSVETFSKGFIKGKHKIYAIKINKHFNVLILEYGDFKILTNYYFAEVNKQIIKYCFILEALKKED